jgi:hypothetical protein
MRRGSLEIFTAVDMMWVCIVAQGESTCTRLLGYTPEEAKQKATRWREKRAENFLKSA